MSDLFDVERHLVHDEQEHVLDVGAGLGGGEQDLPCEMQRRRVELFERGQGGPVEHHAALAHRPELIKEHQWIGAVEQRVLGQAEADAPGGRAAGGGRRRGSGRDRGGGRLVGVGRGNADGSLQAAQQIALFIGVLAGRILDEGTHVIARIENRRDEFGRGFG